MELRSDRHEERQNRWQFGSAPNVRPNWRNCSCVTPANCNRFWKPLGSAFARDAASRMKRSGKKWKPKTRAPVGRTIGLERTAARSVEDSNDPRRVLRLVVLLRNLCWDSHAAGELCGAARGFVRAGRSDH